MKFRPPNPKEYEYIKSLGKDSYVPVAVSEHGQWHVFVYHVIFGSRIAIMQKDTMGPCLDYCCGADKDLLEIVARAVIAAMEKNLSEFCSENDVTKTLPPWRVRPINKDECLGKLLELAYR